MERFPEDFNAPHVDADEPMDLPPGFRFHPTDDELITQYLSPKVLDASFTAKIIAEVDFNKVEPWDLPWMAKIGEKEWYFFCLRDRKYPTGLRTNRATESGYWKATGKDKEIFGDRVLVGMKKTLVFYRGRAPKGVKTNWVMHEYRLGGTNLIRNLPNTAKNEWVICRVFKKSCGGKKVDISCLKRSRGVLEQGCMNHLPPLMEDDDVSCFSNSMEGRSSDQVDEVRGWWSKSRTLSGEGDEYVAEMQEQQWMMFRMLVEDADLKQNVLSNAMGGFKIYEDQEWAAGLQVDQLDCLWNY